MKNVDMTDAIDGAVFRGTALPRQETIAREERFVALVDRHARFVFRVAWAALRNVEDAEDAVQETFLKMYRSGTWTEIADERAFLARAAWRVAMSRRRKRATEQLPPDLRDRAADPERAVIDSGTEAMVHRMIDALPEKLREPLALSALEELDSAAIGRILGIPESTVRGRILQARRLLKRKLEALTEKRNG